MDITGMENKKCGFQSQNLNVTSNSITSNNDSSLKHTHQHNTPPQHRIIQYGIKIPSHQHAQVSQSPSFHTLNFPLYTHVHHPNNQLHFQPAHRHLQAPSQYKNINIHQNFSLPLPQKYIHPHQKQNNQQNQSMYQTTQVSHSNQNQISQNSPQAWVPYQPPPIHYHPKPAGGNDETQKSTQMTPAPQQKSKEVTDKKKSSSTTTQIRFPIAKRPPEAPVTMQGWLHKQGSEGLMLWKKRWFVLSEYCLFYYKGIEEDKLLGSILLPSYKVSICKPEEKLSKKFCFKCEHVNMRTYILAAETHELMMQWVRVLSLASLMQTLSDNSQSSRSLESSRMNQNLSINSSESPGIHYVNKQNNYKPPSTSIHTQSASNCTMEADAEASSNQSQQEQSSCNQPLYANAPPKPRRLNDGYSSPSPDFLDKYNKGGYSDPVYDVRSTAKSPSIYGQNQAHRGMPPDFYQLYSHYTNEYGECMVTPTRELHVLHSTERRTPDTYGRSKLQSVEFQRPADYEDIYDEQSMYKRPLSPAAYSHVIRRNNNPPTVTPVYRAYTPVEMIGPVEHSHYVISQTRKMPVSSIVRPHSADFLEYEMNRHPNSLAKNQQPRPKSSLDINRNVSDNDNYFYSEEQYANKMRKSIQYLQKVPHTPIPQETDKNFPLLRSSTQPIHFNPFLVSDGPSDCQPTRSRSVLSEGSLSKEIDIELDSSHLDRGNTNEYVMRDRCRSANRNVKHRDHDPFIRSASARLTQNSPQPMHQTPMDENQLTREGERKREESMRRLLEWKQRMLQSPLNRKSQQGNKPIHKYSDSYQDNNCSLQDQNHLRHSFQNHQPNERRPSNVAPYTSYSSDDEEIEERRKDNAQSQAGRTLDTFSSKTESPTLAQIPPHTTVNNTFKDPDKPSTQFKHLHNALQYPNACEKLHEDDSEGYKIDEFSKPLQQFSKDSSHIAQVSSLRSEYSGKFEPSPVVTHTKSNGASVKKIFAEKEKETKDEADSTFLEMENANNELIVEENYMPMSPKKNLLAPRSSITSETAKDLDSEENHYVEMTQNTMSPILMDSNTQNEQQPYEMVCFTGGKMEPVYMELKNPELLNDANQELPDILMPSNKNEPHSGKSDSSDADDEESKDLDSLDTPSQPRFSLSDTFRPASYYLGVSRPGPEVQDSSDSELISPPPIPPYPPPPIVMPSPDENSLYLTKIIYEQELKKSEDRQESDKEIYSLKTFPVDKLNATEKKPIQLSTSSNSNADSNFNNSVHYNVDSIMKRKPVSEDFSDELDSYPCSSIDVNNQSTHLERYVNNFPLCSPSITSNEDTNLEVKMDTPATTESNCEYENVVIRGLQSDLNLSTFSNISMFLEDDVMRKDLDTTTHIFSISKTSEIVNLGQNSSCSTPVAGMDFFNDKDISVAMYIADQNDKSFCSIPAPYYYSDLSIRSINENHPVLTLNNQREFSNGGKKDITHIVNPIKCNSIVSNSATDSLESTFKLAAEARSASVDFLNLTDKSGNIDEKNIYESNTLKWQKTTRTDPNLSINSTSVNLYPAKNCDKFSTSDSVSTDTVRRSHSLEGLLENVISQTSEANDEEQPNQETCTNFEGSYIWEEDSVWRERLRTASQRHTKSMEDLETIDSENRKRKPRGITRDVTYVNDLVFKLDNKQEEPDKESTSNEKKDTNFIIDREKLRQWDLLSSAPSDDQLSTVTAIQALEGNNEVVQVGEGNCASPDIAESEETASGSVSINTRDMSRINVRDTFPKAISSKGVWASHMDSRPVTHSYRSVAKDQHGIPKSQCPYINSTPIHSEIDPDSSKDNWPLNDKMNVSAGELLGRTHEELVLLLIQLRRRNAQTLQAIESCYKDIDTTQANLRTIMDQSRRLENLQKLDQIKKHLLELEKQYEKGKPLVNLVDNMVKLGSLYRAPTDRSGQIDNIREKLQFNQQIQERRLLFEEKRDWDRIHTDHLHFQEKVQQLYQLDRLIQEESGILQNLQQDKEDIEQALGGLKRRLSKGLNDPAEIEHARQQQILLENELSRVHLMLAQNSKKLEETVAGNARLEQELLVLKQKLQNSKQQRSSQQYSNAGDSLTCAITLESELQKIQKKVGDLQKQRQELSFQVKQLTDRSSSLTPQKSSAQNSQWNKKKIPSLWRETDLDTMSIVDHGESAETSRSLSCSTSPLYINTESKQMGETEYYNNRNLRSSDSTSDSTSINSNLQHEKQEIKTVRIIKRESERRHRDREKISTGRSEILLEEDDSSQCSSVLFRPTPVQKVQSATSLIPCPYDDNERSRILTGINSVSSPNLPQCFEGEVTSSEDISTDKSPQLSPMFKSEAARQIITEISEHDPPKQFNRRTIPKEKRRHYTAPHNHLLIKSLNQLPLGHNAFDQAVFNTRRARDDMDMERALRQRIDAPDIVRSTLSNKELKYNENTIDNILGTPNKINIPERYIPEQLPQLSVEEQEYRLKKVESIKKMLSDTTIISSSSSNLNIEDKERDNSSPSSIMNKATSKMMEEKKQREHLLQLNQILAKQVMEMSKIVAVKALAKLPLKVHQPSTEEDDSSPLTPLPIYQQRDNFYS